MTYVIIPRQLLPQYQRFAFDIVAMDKISFEFVKIDDCYNVYLTYDGKQKHAIEGLPYDKAEDLVSFYMSYMGKAKVVKHTDIINAFVESL